MLNTWHKYIKDCWHGAQSKLPAHIEKQQEKLKECIHLLDEHEEEILTIHQALDTCFQDEMASIRVAKSLQANLFFSKQSLSKETVAQNIELRKELLGHLLEQLQNYPMLPEGTLTYDVLDTFYQEREAHHQGIKSLIETYLPETYAHLNAEQKQYAAEPCETVRSTL